MAVEVGLVVVEAVVMGVVEVEDEFEERAKLGILVGVLEGGA